MKTKTSTHGGTEDPLIAKLMELVCAAMAERLGSWAAVSARLRQEADRCKKITSKVDTDGPRLRDRAGEDASKLITMWFLTPECVDEAGRPRALKLWGSAPSLEALGQANGVPADSLRERIETLVRLKGVRKLANGRYVPAHQTLMVTDDRVAMRDRGAKILSKLIGTFVHNLSEGNRTAREFERNVHAARLKTSEIPEFRRFLASQGQMFIEAIDFWLDERQAMGDARSAEVIVEIFSNVQDNDVTETGVVRDEKRRAEKGTQRQPRRRVAGNLTGSVK